MSDSKGQFSCRGEEWFSCFAVFGRWGVGDMERLHEDASGADGHMTHLPLDYGHTNLYRRQNVIEAHTGKNMGGAG